jgi:hypothetical protein
MNMRNMELTPAHERHCGVHLQTGFLFFAPIERLSRFFLRQKRIVAERPSHGYRVPNLKIQAIAACIFFWSLPAHATVITAATCSSSDVQAAVNSAVNGDTVMTPGPCTVAWPGAPGVTISGKGITLDGGGNTTVTSVYAILLQSSLTASARVTGINFTGGGDLNNGDIRATGSTSSAPFRIDHCTLSNGGTLIAVWNNAPGLIDHDTFNVGGAAETIHNFGMGAGNAAGWADDIVPGGPKMLFIEDNVFNNSDPTYIAQSVEAYYGARTVVRHNTMNFVAVDEHGNSGTLNGVSARWWEIYQNTFSANGKAQCCNVTVRGGSGVIFGNAQSNNTAPGAITLKEDIGNGFPGSCSPPDPDLYHVGRGINSTLSPAFVWSNGTIPVNGDNCIRSGTEYRVSTSQPSNLMRCESAADQAAGCPVPYVYTPYQYPHPLQGSAVAAPTGLAFVIH